MLFSTMAGAPFPSPAMPVAMDPPSPLSSTVTFLIFHFFNSKIYITISEDFPSYERQKQKKSDNKKSSGLCFDQYFLFLFQQVNSNKYRTSGMDLFLNAKAVRLRSHHDKYLLADEDEESVTQDRKGSSRNARWTVEFVPGSENIIRLKSTYNRYLTASNQPFLLGMTGRKVTQTLPRRLDSSVEWEPIKEGSQIKLKTRYGNFLRANGGLPPWRNSVTHDIPHRTATQDWVLWDVHIVEIQEKKSPVSTAHQAPPSFPPAIPHADSPDFDSTLPSSVLVNSGNFTRQQV